jgi:hypothetical protein
MPILHDIAEMIVALVVLWGAIQSSRNGRKLEVIHKATNSLTDRLVATTAVSAEATGFERGRQQQIVEETKKQ